MGYGSHLQPMIEAGNVDEKRIAMVGTMWMELRAVLWRDGVSKVRCGRRSGGCLNSHGRKGNLMRYVPWIWTPYLIRYIIW